MAGIGDQGERVRAKPECDLGDDERDVESDPHGEGAIESRRRVRVAVAPMVVSMAVRVVAVRMIMAVVPDSIRRLPHDRILA